MMDSSNLPKWLDSLLAEKFFKPCIIHEGLRKNEKNILCLDCCESICSHCLSSHSSHRLLQIRRYVYHEVIRLGDAEKLMDCGYVQSYTTNNAKVVFLNAREHSRPNRGSGNICITCYRGLQQPYLFCSLSCKLERIVRTGVGLSRYLHKCEHLTLPELGLDNSKITHDSVLEPVGSLRTESGSSGGEISRTLSCTDTTEIERKERSSTYQAVCSPVSEVGPMMNRRKGTPHRSPLF